MKLVFLLIISFVSIILPQSGSGTVSGFVFDSKTGEALIGTNVYFKDLNIGSSTNNSGYFSIPDVPIGKRSLVISFIGYKVQQLDIDVKVVNNKMLRINLTENAVQTREVVVVGDSVRTIDKLANKPVSTIELNAQQINNIPRVIEADLLRSLQSLPGIQPLSDFSSALYVRGGTPDQNIYLIDGTDVYNPEHAFGLFSTFNTSAIKKVEFSKGGFGAEYGGRLSSVLNVTNLDGNRYEFKGDINVSLISASATLQAPLWDIGSISGSFRRTYIDQTYAKVVDEIPDYYFYDGNVKAYFDLDEENKLTISFYGGRDDLKYILNEGTGGDNAFIYNWGNATGSINYKRIFSPGLFGNFWITGSMFDSDFDFQAVNFSERNRISDVAVKGNMEYYFSRILDFKFGFEYKNLFGSLKEKFQGGLVDASKKRKHYTGYLTSNLKATDKFLIQAGLRYDFFDSEKNYQNIDPRLTLKYRLSDLDNLKFSFGMYHQYLNRIPRLFLTSIWTTSDQYHKGSSSIHYIAGYQREIAQIYELEFEVYYKNYKDIYSYNQNYITDIIPDSYNDLGEPVFVETRGLFNRGDGHSYGAELMLRKDYGAITGWLGYSYAISKSTTEGLNRNRSYTPRHDRTHTINFVSNININDLLDELYNETSESSSKWLVSFNFVYATGQPITLPGSIYAAYTMPDWTNNTGNIAIYPSEINSAKLPPYIRLDFSLTWEKNYGSWTLAPYLQIFNVGDRSNVWFISYENKIENGIVKQEIENQNMIPILPSLGVNIKF